MWICKKTRDLKISEAFKGVRQELLHRQVIPHLKTLGFSLDHFLYSKSAVKNRTTEIFVVALTD